MDSVWDSKGPNLVPDHIIQLLLHLCRWLCALSQDHICVNALPLDVMVNPASNSAKASGLASLLHVSALCFQMVILSHGRTKRRSKHSAQVNTQLHATHESSSR